MDSLYPIEYHDTTLADGAPSNYVRIEEVSEDKGAKQIVSQLRSWVNAPSLNRFSGLWLLNYAPGWPTPRRAGPHLAEHRTRRALGPRPPGHTNPNGRTPPSSRRWWRVAKVVSAQSLTKSLTTFEDFYQTALPEEQDAN